MFRNVDHPGHDTLHLDRCVALSSHLKTLCSVCRVSPSAPRGRGIGALDMDLRGTYELTTYL